MAHKAMDEGASPQAFRGRMRRYLDGIADGATLRVYAGHVFVFRGLTLITGWPVPSDLRKSKAKHP